MSTRVLLVDDHQMVRAGLRLLVEREPGFSVVGESGDGEAAVAAASAADPDVVVMDVTMPGLNGIDATRAVLDAVPHTRVLCLSVHGERDIVAAAFAAGATGYLPKECAADELVEAIRVVGGRRTYLSPAVAGPVVQDYVGRLAQAHERPSLSARERQVLQLIAEGHSTRDIAARLYVSPKTVATHREHIKAKLGLGTVAELTKYAIRCGLTGL